MPVRKKRAGAEGEQATGLITVPARIRATPAGRSVMEAVGEALPDDDRFIFEAEISNTGTDAYFTHMAADTLRNFAKAAADGVALLDSHSGLNLAVGYSAGGRFVEEDGAGRTVARFYIMRGIRFGGRHSYASTDDYITAIEGGIVRDVSVGFYGGRWMCDICKSPYYGVGGCNHIAGWEYEVEADNGRTERVVCTVTIHDADLSEVSLVYDGATPGAMILKAEQEAAAGRMSPEMLGVIEQQYRIKLHGQPGGDYGVDDVEGERAMSGREQDVVIEEAESVTETVVDEVRLALNEAAAPEGMAAAEAVRWLAAQLAQATSERDSARQEVARLQPLADQGRAYRDELVNQAVAEGVRALGEAFPEETYRAMLTAAPLEHIRQVRDTFAGQAAERYPGGRQTRDMNEEKKGVESKVPAAAYGVRA